MKVLHDDKSSAQPSVSSKPTILLCSSPLSIRSTHVKQKLTQIQQQQRRKYQQGKAKVAAAQQAPKPAGELPLELGGKQRKSKDEAQKENEAMPAKYLT